MKRWILVVLLLTVGCSQRSCTLDQNWVQKAEKNYADGTKTAVFSFMDALKGFVFFCENGKLIGEIWFDQGGPDGKVRGPIVFPETVTCVTSAPATQPK